MRTNVRYDAAGEPSVAFVAIYPSDDQRKLFDIIEAQLSPDRRRQFEDLVLAREPIPDDLLKRMSNARKRGWSPKRIAATLNERGIITGMGGIQWTPRKVTAALATYKDTVGKLQAAA